MPPPHPPECAIIGTHVLGTVAVGPLTISCLKALTQKMIARISSIDKKTAMNWS